MIKAIRGPGLTQCVWLVQPILLLDNVVAVQEVKRLQEEMSGAAVYWLVYDVPSAPSLAPATVLRCQLCPLASTKVCLQLLMGLFSLASCTLTIAFQLQAWVSAALLSWLASGYTTWHISL